MQDRIVQWMNTMRLGDGGFISTVDTVVALESLVKYSYNSRIKDITDLEVEVDVPDSNMTHTFHIVGDDKIARLQRMDIPNVWGHVNLIAHGAGQAIAQLDVNWGVDYEPFKVIITNLILASHLIYWERLFGNGNSESRNPLKL